MIVTRIIGAAVLLSGFANAVPHRLRRQDSAINEPAVSAPNGTPITEGSEAAATAAPADNMAVEAAGWSSAADQSSSAWDAASTTVAWEASATTSTAAWNSYQTPTYGSGSSSWGNSNSGSYNDCVSQCLAQYGNTPQAWQPPTQTVPDQSGSGNGVTHTVIVAPSQGVLRYVPFAVNASVGDTVKFMWGANNHTVTKSDALTPCNKTLDGPFASGIQIKDFVFSQVINDTNPVYFHCAVPGHCQKGMFGVINPASNAGAATSVSQMMSTWTSSNPNLAAYSTYADSMTKDNTAASRWGGNMDVAPLPEWSHPYVAENIMYTRTFLASNPETMKEDGSIDLSNGNSTPLMIPQDISGALNNAGASAPPSAETSASVPAVQSPAPSGDSTANTANLTNGAAAGSSPKFIVAFMAAAAGFFLL